MARYERAGKVEVPKWWLDKVLPILDHQSTNYSALAKAASEHAGRKSPWGRDAISKFKTGIVRTIDLANGISDALHVPRPFFTAPSEQAAIEMHQVINRDHDRTHIKRQLSQDDVEKLDTYDAAAEREIQATEPHRRVISPDHGSKTGRGGRDGRAGRGGS